MGNTNSLRNVALMAFVLLCASAPLSASACPALAAYYPADPSRWPQVRAQLTDLQPECLDNSEYFALLGASQLNTGQLAPALEALERALLLDPANGAAQIDYAQALYLAGQLFPALELNRSLLDRSDTPPHLAPMLQERQDQWMEQTTSRGLIAEVGLGYDDNLNGAPSRSDLTLTLSGEPVQLTLDEAFQPISDPYLNLRLAGFYQRLSPDFSHDLMGAVRNRTSEHSQSDLIQLDWRYSLGSMWRRWNWNLTAGTSHLIYGGSPLYSVSETRFHFRPEGSGCRPQYEAAGQYQLYHGQSIFSGVETSVSAGLECRPEGQTRIFGFEAGAVANQAIKDQRPGADRKGWKLRFYWQQELGKGVLDTQFSLASLDDDSGYNELLANGARREVSSRLFRLQYRQNLQERLDFLASLSHQGQSSNLVPFENSGTAFELGLSYSL